MNWICILFAVLMLFFTVGHFNSGGDLWAITTFITAIILICITLIKKIWIKLILSVIVIFISFYIVGVTKNEYVFRVNKTEAKAKEIGGNLLKRNEQRLNGLILNLENINVQTLLIKPQYQLKDSLISIKDKAFVQKKEVSKYKQIAMLDYTKSMEEISNLLKKYDTINRNSQIIENSKVVGLSYSFFEEYIDIIIQSLEILITNYNEIQFVNNSVKINNPNIATKYQKLIEETEVLRLKTKEYKDKYRNN